MLVCSVSPSASGSTTVNSAPPSGPSATRAPPPMRSANLPHQREPEPPLAVRGRLLGRPALGEDQLPQLGGDAGTVVTDPHDHRTSLGAQLHLHRGAGRPGRRVQRVVDAGCR